MKSVTDVCKQFWKPNERHYTSNSSHVVCSPNFKKFASRLASSNDEKRIAAQKQLGILKEDFMLDEYERLTNSKVTHRNSKNLKCQIGNTMMIGRIDGLVEDTIIEHKYRCKGILGYVPVHELIQCHFYMYMTQKNSCKLLESSLNTMVIHVLTFDNVLWERTMRTCDL